MKRVLMNASVASMIYKFNMNNIDILEKLGYQVDIACNFGKENPISQEEIDEFRKILSEKEIHVFETMCPRSIFAVKNMWSCYKQLRNIANQENYDMVYTQSPIGGVICRLAFREARKKGTKVIYAAHGFHFYKGAPIFNWLVFYPIEKLCSNFTDILITINEDDYELVKKFFHVAKVVHIPGVGIDTKKYGCYADQVENIRRDLKIMPGELMLLSVGELNENKNHELVIRAIEKLENVKYVIAGSGNLQEYLQDLVEKLGMTDRVQLIGFRNDVPQLAQAADLFAFPTKREGLGLAALEAMASGTPVVGMDTRGIHEYVIDGKTGFLFSNSVESCKKSIECFIRLSPEKLREMKDCCIEKSKMYSMFNSEKILKEIYGEI